MGALKASIKNEKHERFCEMALKDQGAPGIPMLSKHSHCCMATSPGVLSKAITALGMSALGGIVQGMRTLYCAGDKVPEDVRQHLKGAAVAIWTTTGWTIPANQAVAVNERLQYAIVEAQASSITHELISRQRCMHCAQHTVLVMAFDLIFAEMLPAQCISR